MAEAFIHVEGLRFSYEDGERGERTEVLHGIDLDIEEGSFVAVLGHNGSGKSTLAKLLNMILLPDSGRIVIDGSGGPPRHRNGVPEPRQPDSCDRR